jgi:hypothetical protein
MLFQNLIWELPPICFFLLVSWSILQNYNTSHNIATFHKCSLILVYKFICNFFQYQCYGFGNEFIQTIKKTNRTKLLNLWSIWDLWQESNYAIVNSTNIDYSIMKIIKQLNNVPFDNMPTWGSAALFLSIWNKASFISVSEKGGYPHRRPALTLPTKCDICILCSSVEPKRSE